ncbi:hypothetical protein [Maribacter stanieri]|uniref:hypothetical protein n=1 Tax=Maribacter stanieri TaxID=440514 RepID=UPI0024954152|nr:hypothetical protein [Maribacter stanieri]
MLDRYFNYAILADIIVSSLIAAIFYYLNDACIIKVPSTERLISIISDISNVAFTSAGFVLTFLTLLVSFKISANPIKKEERISLEETYKKISIFNLFLSSPLYSETIRHLKNGVKELLVIAILGYGVKLLAVNISDAIMFYLSVFGIVVISLVLWRSLLVLSGVLSVQDKEEK